MLTARHLDEQAARHHARSDGYAAIRDAALSEAHLRAALRCEEVASALRDVDRLEASAHIRFIGNGR